MALVPDDAERKADQDRGQGHPALEVRDVSNGRGGRDAELVWANPRPHCAVGDAAAGCLPDTCVECRGVRKRFWTQGAVRALPVPKPRRAPCGAWLRPWKLRKL